MVNNNFIKRFGAVIITFVCSIAIWFLFDRTEKYDMKPQQDTIPIETVESVLNCSTENSVPIEPIPSSTIESVEAENITFRVTAYCPCEICCGKWASMRPIDENGNPIVFGASGFPLESYVSCASTFPFGTQIELDGIGTVEVQDRTATWLVDKYGENIIDIYMEDHEAAKEFGVQYVEGVIKR